MSERTGFRRDFDTFRKDERSSAGEDVCCSEAGVTQDVIGRENKETHIALKGMLYPRSTSRSSHEQLDHNRIQNGYQNDPQ